MRSRIRVSTSYLIVFWVMRQLAVEDSSERQHEAAMYEGRRGMCQATGGEIYEPLENTKGLRDTGFCKSKEKMDYAAWSALIR